MWVQDGSNWYYYNADGTKASGWVVNSTYKNYGLQRYWLDKSTDALTFSQLIIASDAGYYAYATKYGYVVRGKY
jgi:glucan-binding YG repeat protein